jgi:hypothetical protein
MDEAVVVFTRKGSFQTRIGAHEIRSKEHARKLWPLVSSDTLKQMVTWVSPSFENNKLSRRAHFRLLPSEKRFDPKKLFDNEETQRQNAIQESPEHQLAKRLIATELSQRLSRGLAMPWSFKDTNASDYPLKGNLLLGADEIKIEYLLKTPFNSQYRLDIAVLGAPILSEPMVLGGIEIEFGHVFDGRKALIGKSLGFPLISIDIAEMALEELTPEWARTILAITTWDRKDGRRQSYIYLHDLLYPLYLQFPVFLDNDKRHQLLIFAEDNTLQKLIRWTNALANQLGYSNGAVAASLVNGKSKQSWIMLERAGLVVGSDWQDFNDHQCLRLTFPRAKNITDIQAHRFHMTMARLLLSHTNALVGYKYRNGIDNDEPKNDIWVANCWVAELKTHSQHRILPKRLAEPINRILKVVSELQNTPSKLPSLRQQC